MSDWKLRAYHALPHSLRSAVATLRGHQLKRWRFGPETDWLVEEARARESWSTERWKTWREERLRYVLHRAATRVPYYRAHWEQRRRRGDRALWEDLTNWPVLTKDLLRATPRAFVADDCDVRAMFHERTSGTSGKPLDLWWTRETVRAWSALVEARIRGWHGVSRHEPWAILGGQPVVPGAARRPPFWVHNRAMKQLYLSANHVSPRFAPDFVAAIEAHSASHLWAYASSSAFLAAESARQGVAPPIGLKAVFTNAEPVHPWQREAIRNGLGCEARETYGMAEIAMAGSECAHGVLHLWPEVGWTEVWADAADEHAAPGAAGRFICTSLLNADMPLVRYELGDRGRLHAAEWRCACGRALPGIAEVQGRSNDMLLAADGRRVFWLNPVLYGLPLREAQIVQEELGAVLVRLVPADGFGAGDEETIRERLRSRLGACTVAFERVERIPCEPNGKFRAVKCLVPPDAR